MGQQTVKPEELKHIRIINNLRKISKNQTQEMKYSKPEIAKALYWSCNKTLKEVDELIENLHE